jgi:hypothetical protein
MMGEFMLQQFIVLCCFCLLCLSGCEDTDVRMAAEASLSAAE